jgi:hypothetical protein
LHTPQADTSTSGATPSVNFFGAWVKLQGLKQLPKVSTHSWFQPISFC